MQNFVSYDALQHFNLGILEFNVGAVHGDHADYWPLVYRRQNAGRGIGDDCRGDVLDQDEKHQVGDSLLLSVDYGNLRGSKASVSRKKRNLIRA